MAAGLGFKDFVTGEVLTAADVDGYLMQGVWVFASAAARDAAVTSPQEGNFAYLKDTNVTTYYTGSAWANLDTTGMTNPMTTTGDIIYSSPGSTPVRLGIGTAGQVLKVNSGATAPEWGTAASGGGWTSLASGSLSGTSTSVNITTTGYYQVVAFVKNVKCTTDFYLGFDLNTDSGSNYSFITQYGTNAGSTVVAATNRSATTSIFVDQPFQLDANAYGAFVINDPANTNAHKMISGIAAGTHYDNSYNLSGQFFGRYMSNSAITNIRFQPASTFSTGTYEIYGVK